MRRYKLSVISSQLSAFNKSLLKAILFTVFCLLFTTFSFCQKANEAIKQGNEAYRKNDFATAIKEYTKAVQADDKNEVAKFNLANAWQQINGAEKAGSLYDEAIKNSTDADLQSKAYYNKALGLLQQKNVPAAIDAFKQSLRLLPSDGDARENLQKALNEQKQQQQQNQNQKQQPQQQQQPKKQQKQQAMNRQMMEEKFKELQDQEKQLQKEIQKQKITQQDPEKDW